MSRNRLTYLALIMASPTAFAVDVAQEPLFMSQQATPNVMFVLDDSGSMDWEILTKKHLRTNAYDPDYRRRWARGVSKPKDKWDSNWRSENFVETGEWYSYSGYCRDKSVDGLCGNQRDYSGLATDYSSWVNSINGKTHDGQKRGQDYNGYPCKNRVIPEHTHTDLHYYQYHIGYCQSLESTSDADVYFEKQYKYAAQSHKEKDDNTYFLNEFSFKPASSWFADVLGWVTGSSLLQASGACIEEVAPQSDTTSGNYVHDDKRYQYTTEEETSLSQACNNNPGTTWVTSWSWERDSSKDVITVVPEQVIYTPALPSLDLNGDGLINPIHSSQPYDQQFTVHDSFMSGVTKFNYLYPFNDNVYQAQTSGTKPDKNSPPFEDRAYYECAVGGDHAAVYSCAHLQFPNYPDDYPYDASLGEVATSSLLAGNENILSLPDRTRPQVRDASAIYPWGNPPYEFKFSDVKWAGPLGPDTETVEGTHHAVSQYDPWPVISDWRIRSADFNVLYYSQEQDYQPWIGLSDANFNAAKSNPQPGSEGYSLTTDLARPIDGVEAGFVYAVALDDSGFWQDPRTSSGGDTGECGRESDPFNKPSRGYYISSYSYSVYADYNTRKKFGLIDTDAWPSWTHFYHYYTGKKGAYNIKDPATGILTQRYDKVCSGYADYPNTLIDLWDSRYRVTVKNNEINVQKIKRFPHIFGEKVYPNEINPNTWGYGASAVSAGDEYLFSVLETDIQDVATYTAGNTYPVDGFCELVLGVDPNNKGMCRSVEQVKQNVANWFEYSRKRSFVAKSSISSVINELSNLRYGLASTSSSSGVPNLFKPLPSGLPPYAAHNNDLIQGMLDYKWPAEATPLRSALKNVGEYFKGNAPAPHNVSPIVESCQRNYAVMITDGYWSNDDVSGIADEDGDGYFSAISKPTLADVAHKYYNTDLSPLIDNVPTTLFNQNNKQHLTTIGVGFGVSGILKDNNGNGWPGGGDDSSHVESSDWGDPGQNTKSKIDDLWHAAYNSRGKYLSADNPQELYDSIRSAVLESASLKGSASALSSNSNALTASTRIYQTLFTNTSWTGDVLSYSLDNQGKPNATPIWSAQQELDKNSVNFNNRRIITMDSDGNGIPFRWNDLSVEQKDLMSIVYPQTEKSENAFYADYIGQSQVNYVRGKEVNGFRSRSSRLGDIVHSKPVYVGAPSADYPSTFGTSSKRYSDFFNNKSLRNPIIYVGANDGMLHAFEESTGKELFAYIPSMLISKLNRLAYKGTRVQPYEHHYYVNATPTVADAFFTIQNKWKTVLVGGLGAGGKGVYALDITDAPISSDTEGVLASTKVLWEFSSEDDPDMGQGGHEPVITKLHNDKWAAIFSNGWNSRDHKSVLFIVDLETGDLIKKFDTGVGDIVNQNGMAPPSVVDWDGDSIADVIYSGDLQGNLWKVDLSGTTPSSWNISFSGQPLIAVADENANKQPITQKPLVRAHPLGYKAGVLIYFGTGRYLGFSDNAPSSSRDSLYAVWDRKDNVLPVSRTELLEQEILSELTASSEDVRVTSDNPIKWLSDGVALSDYGWSSNIVDHGWYIDLDSDGERIASVPVLRGDTILFSTLMPSENPCTGGVTGWLMALNAENGARFDSPRIDINNDGQFDSNDIVNWTDSDSNTETASVSGIKSKTGIPSAPLVLSDGQGNGNTGRVLTDSSNGSINSVNLNDARNVGRQSWIQIR